MAFDPVTSKSRSVALRLEPDSVVFAGRKLNFEVAPKSTATARTLLGDDPVSAVSLALGLGLGDSRFYADSISSSDFFDSQNITLKSGGNSYIGGQAVAAALASSPFSGDAKAEAINIGLANVDFIDQYGGLFSIGSSDNPFSSTSTSSTQIDSIGGLEQSDQSSISAKSIVRGLEGSSADFNVDQFLAQELFFDDRPSFYGQPDANVEANVFLNKNTDISHLKGNLTSDAVAIEGYQITNSPFGNFDQSSSVRGSSFARIDADFNSSLNEDEVLQLSINADGIRNSIIHSASSLDTYVEGSGLALVEAIPLSADFETARATGISSSIIVTNHGDDVIQANAGLGIRSASPQEDVQTNGLQYDVAAVDQSWISSGAGHDKLHASILSESEASFDSNGNGVFESDVYLDHESTSNPLLSGYAGFRDSFIHTGSGNDSISGSSLNSKFLTDLGDDSITLDRLSDSSIWSGLGDDAIFTNGSALNSVFWGGQGNDQISVQSGSGNILNGGLGQDHITSGTGTDTIEYSDSAAAVRSASVTSLSEDLGDADYWENLSSEQKTSLWNTGVMKSDQDAAFGVVETAQDLSFGEGGDVLNLSSSMAGFTQDLWDQYGQIYEVDESGSLTFNGSSLSGSNRIGFAVGKHEDLMKMGTSAPSFAYATDTKTLLYDADGFWDDGVKMISVLQSNQQDSLQVENLRFQ